MRRFQTTSTNNVTFEEDGVRYFVPADEGNADYRDYLAWVAEGNIAEPWQPEESVIEEQPIVEEPISEEPVIEDAN